MVPKMPELSCTRDPTSRLFRSSVCAATCLRIGRIMRK
ncbi:Uncharacterised protein [Mycobacteroides abscessus subsp. abscessus]|nr:Uncharacterised protein [Mycobacteroides abscessus subsp. abscessus]